MKAYENCNLSIFGVGYVGQQEITNGVNLDMFNDLKTKSTFLRIPGETVLEARDRIREGYKKK